MKIGREREERDGGEGREIEKKRTREQGSRVEQSRV